MTFIPKAPQWSPLEVGWLLSHRISTSTSPKVQAKEIAEGRVSLEQACIILSKSKNAITKMLALLEDDKEITVLDGVASHVPQTSRKKKSKQGMRQDLGRAFRSGWEANFRRLLDHPDSPWEFLGYEDTVYDFRSKLTGDVRGKAVDYTPDFRVKDKKTGEELFVEIKGRMYPQDNTKMRRLKQFFPEVWNQLLVITNDNKPWTTLGIPANRIFSYAALARQYKDSFPEWEGAAQE